MLRHIYIKLFAMILGTNALVAVLMYAGVSWSFDREFREHLRRQELERLDAVAAELADGYGRAGNWDWVANDPRRWSDLLRRYLSPPRRERDEGPGVPALPAVPALPEAPTATEPRAAPDSREAPGAQAAQGTLVEGPRRADTITFSPRLLLLDAEQRLRIGPADLASRAVLRPVVWRGQTVGYLGYLPRDDLIEALDRLFARRQRFNFAILTGAMLVAAMLLSAGIALWISRPVRQLADGTRALARGDFQVRTSVRGRDELAQLAADFNALGEALLQGRRARERWLADISHELRTPLAVLRAEVEALQDGVRDPNPETLSSLAQEVGKLARLVEDLHTLSLSDQGALAYRMESMDLSRLVREELENVEELLDDAGLGLQVNLAPQAPMRGDARRLSQLLDNLRQNTLRYTDAPGHLRVSTRAPPGKAVLCWEDSPPGVPPPDLPHLTDRLYRVESSRSRAGGGSGLGLAIARAIVEAHGGTMTPGASELGGLAWNIEFPSL